MRYGLPERVIQKIQTIFAQYPQVDEAILYGSRAKGNYRNGSDIDLTLKGGNDLTAAVLYNIINELEEQLLPYTIDLSLYSDITDPDMLGHIQRVGITFYRKP